MLNKDEVNALLEKLRLAPRVKSIANPSISEFKEASKQGQEPLLIKDGIEMWKASKEWTIDYLVEHLGAKEIFVAKQSSTEEVFVKMSFKEFASQVRDDLNSEPLYANFSHHLDSRLINDYQTPDYFDCWYKKLPKEDQKIRLSWIYLGTKYSYSKFHTDIHNTSAWNAVFQGKKLWLFFPPTISVSLYEGKVNPFKLDSEIFPKFEDVNPLVCVQETKQIVFTPSGWSHCVLNLEKGFSLTENFINETNFENVFKDFESVGALKAMQKLNYLKTMYH